MPLALVGEPRATGPEGIALCFGSWNVTEKRTEVVLCSKRTLSPKVICRGGRECCGRTVATKPSISALTVAGFGCRTVSHSWMASGAALIVLSRSVIPLITSCPQSTE